MNGLDEIYKQSFSARNLTSSNKLPPAEQLKKFFEKLQMKYMINCKKPEKHIYHILMLLLIQGYMQML